MEDVVKQLKRNGWEQTGSLGERVLYFENSRIGITVVDGPMGVLVMPSGPIRGRVFGDSGLQINQSTVLGAGSSSSDPEKNRDKAAASRQGQFT